MDEELKLDRTTTEITFDPHVFNRQQKRHFDLDFVEETVRTGTIVEEKSERPLKACFKKYHGKERITYCVIALFRTNFIEVKTVWLIPGRC